MSSPITFCKLSGSGNDFICIDNRDGTFDAILATPAGAGHFARTLCHRGTGVGADGVVFAGTPEVEGVADIAARFLEPDGGEASLCGNGTACFIRWARLCDMIGDGEVKVLTPAGVVTGQDLDAQDGYVRVCIPLPEDLREGLELEVDGKTISCDYVVTGVEHLITYVDDVAKTDVAHLGAALRHHKRFPQPQGVNANFVQVLAEGRLAVRTYEYGVEAETLACGTGSAGAAVLACRRFGWSAPYRTGDAPITVRAPSGDVLRVYVTIDEADAVTDLCLETHVRCAYDGTLCGSLAAEAMQTPEPTGTCADARR